MNAKRFTLDIQHFAAKAGLTKEANFSVTAREIDFVTRFGDNWKALMEIMSIMRPIRKTPGTQLKSYTTALTLESGTVAEGDEIPYSQATITEAYKEDLAIEKYAKAVSVEAVSKYGAVVAVEKTDNAFLNQLQSKVMGDFYTFLQTGTLLGGETTFQKAIAMAIGKVTDKFKKMHKDVTEIVVFVNTIDVYKYLGSAEISIQTANGVQYLKNFLGASTVIISSEIAEGTVIAVPAENIDLYYIDPSDSDFAKLGLSYTTDGVTNLLGFHAQGDYSHAVGESYAIMGMKLWAEYMDGIAIEFVGTETKVTTAETVTVKSGTTTVFETAHANVVSVEEVKVGSNAVTTGYTVNSKGLVFDTAPSGAVTVKYTYIAV